MTSPYRSSLQEFADARAERPTAIEVMMRFAELLATRSTCARKQVGAVVTDRQMLQVLGIGYNGNARGLSNGCDSNEPGGCGCVHAELNALLKAPGTQSEKQLFSTLSPCVPCAKAIINSGITIVYFRNLYRLTDGLRFMRRSGISIFQVTDGTLTPYSSTLLETIGRVPPP